MYQVAELHRAVNRHAEKKEARHRTGRQAKVAAGIELQLWSIPMASDRQTFDPIHPKHLSPEQRLEEVTSILATGITRLLSLRARLASAIPPDSTPNCLDVSEGTRLHVHPLVNARRGKELTA